MTESRRRSSNLLVSKVDSRDAGNYTCAPSNALPVSVSVHVIEGRLTIVHQVFLWLLHAAHFLSLLAPSSSTDKKRQRKTTLANLVFF